MRHHHIHNDSCWPNIAFLIIAFEQNFRGYIIRRAYSLIQALVAFLFNSDTEIYDFEVISAFFKKHILRFDISVYHSFVVEIKNSFEYLLDDLCNIFLTKIITD